MHKSKRLLGFRWYLEWSLLGA